MKFDIQDITRQRIFFYPLVILSIFSLSACTTSDKSSLIQNALMTASQEASETANTQDENISARQNAASTEKVEISQDLDEQTRIAAHSLSITPVNLLPVPATRDTDAPIMAFASAQSKISPASVASEMQFQTPAHAPAGLDDLIKKYSSEYQIPERLVRRVVHRESRFNPAARNGPYYGLMQISHPTARVMGYQGPAHGLLDAETNLKYAVKYLAGAYLVADGDESQAVKFYARGYYYDAKRKGLLVETGLRPAR